MPTDEKPIINFTPKLTELPDEVRKALKEAEDALFMEGRLQADDVESGVAKQCKPLLIVADMASEASQMVITELNAEGKYKVIDPDDICLADIRDLSERGKVQELEFLDESTKAITMSQELQKQAQSFDKLAEDTKTLGNGFKTLEMAAQMLQQPLLKGGGGGYTGKRMGKKWVKKRKTLTRMQAASRKANR